VPIGRGRRFIGPACEVSGGVVRTLSFRAHRTGDIAQAALASLGPILFGLGNDPEAKYVYGQAASEACVIAATDWDAAA
jgi:hypothetical protein